MTKEQFIALGLSEEQATKAAEASKEELKTFIPKTRFDEVNDAKKQLEKDIATRDQQIEDLKKVDAAGLKAEIERLQGENKAAKEKYAADMKDLAITNAIKLAITDKAQDTDLVTGLIDKTKLAMGDDGKITGLDEQVKTLKESKPFLFKEEKSDKGTLFNFKGVKPQEGREDKGQGNDNDGEFGKKLAEAASKNTEGLSQARDSYFK